MSGRLSSVEDAGVSTGHTGMFRCIRIGLNDHPGVPHLAMWCVLGLLIAGRDDWRKGVLAAALMLVLFGPMILHSAYTAGRRELIRKAREAKTDELVSNSTGKQA